MIHLTNIRIEGDWILAHAFNRNDNTETDIAVSITHNDLKVANGDMISDFAKAALDMKYRYITDGKLPEEYEINWGM
jgi:hypothetical protein